MKLILILLIAVITINVQAATVIIHRNEDGKITTFPYSARATLTDSMLTIEIDNNSDGLVVDKFLIVTKNTSNPDIIKYGIVTTANPKLIYDMNVTDNTIAIYASGDANTTHITIISGYTDNTNPVDESSKPYVAKGVWITIAVIATLIVTALLAVYPFKPRV